MAISITKLHPNDDVGIALVDLEAGLEIDRGVTTNQKIQSGHKVALKTIHSGEPILRYNQIIGIAKHRIVPGEHVHGHNLKMYEFQRDYGFCADKKPTQDVDNPRTFEGIMRPDGRIATRNYIGVVSSVNCSATVARAIADHFRGRLEKYPNIDGVVALTHKSGCGLDAPIEVT